jgi:hypothetical protein
LPRKKNFKDLYNQFNLLAMKKLILTAFIFLNSVVVSHAQIKHSIGEKFGGGIVFDISNDSIHGLIAETVDQGKCNFLETTTIVKNGIHNSDGKVFNDWRLPDGSELIKLYEKRSIIGGFSSNFYWSSELKGSGGAWCRDFSIGEEYKWVSRSTICYVRAIRSF